MVENIAKVFENKLTAAVDRVNLKVTGGRGIDYVDENWDFIEMDDDYFLDTFNSKIGTDEVTR